MKTSIIATIAILGAILLSISALKAQDAPSIPLEKAAQIAQATLAGQHLPANNFLRSISLQHRPSETPPDYYLATFEPPAERRIMSSSSTPAAPIKVKLIKITFDGQASIIEQDLPGIRVIRKEKTTP